MNANDFIYNVQIINYKINMSYSFLSEIYKDPRQKQWYQVFGEDIKFRESYKNPVKDLCDGLIYKASHNCSPLCNCGRSHYLLNCLSQPIYNKNGKKYCEKCVKEEGYYPTKSNNYNLLEDNY